MSDHYSDSEAGDGAAHDELLNEIRQLNKPVRERSKAYPKVQLQAKTTEKVDLADLLGSIKSTRNLNELKKKLALDKPRKRSKKRNAESNGAPTKYVAEKKDVIDVPLHRQAKRRIESEIAYNQSKQDLKAWNPIVHSYRVAEQITFPLGEEKSIYVNNAEDKVDSFQPRTELENLMVEAMGKSKYHIRNNEAYSEAEKEIIKSMSLKEAKQKCAELQKMRALMSFKAAKLKQQSKIKSKQYHRIKKRQKHRILIKEIEDLMVRDPEKAKEKLGELEKDRAFERGTLKHRTNKWNKHIKQFASKNPELRKLMEDHMRLGRELKSRHELHEDCSDSALENDSDDDDQNLEAVGTSKKLTVGEIVKLAVEQADRESNALETMEKAPEVAKVNPFYRSALENLRREHRQALKSTDPKAGRDVIQDAKSSRNVKKPSVAEASKEAVKREDRKSNVVARTTKNQPIQKPPVETPKVKYVSRVSQENRQIETPPLPKLIDLKANDITIESVLELDQIGGIEEDFLAEAYENDSVLGDFEDEKQRVEDEEKPEALDLTLHGWGSWTGPGIVDRKKDRFIVKPKLKRRKDSQNPRVIIREKISSALANLQPRDVPFPFTNVQDFETYIQQPLGREWNTPMAQAKLIQPKISTKAGRIIRAVDKDEKHRHKVAEQDSDDD